MKTATLTCLALCLSLFVNGQTFTELISPAGGDGIIDFYTFGTTKKYTILKTSMRGSTEPILSFQYYDPFGGSGNLMNFVKNSVVIGPPSFTSDNFYVNGSSAFYGDVNVLDRGLNQSIFSVEPKASFANTTTFYSKVGIGTENPLEKLHVNGAIRGGETGGSLRIQSDSGYLILGSQNSTQTQFKTDRSRFSFNKSIYISNGLIASEGSTDLKLHTNNNQRMIIKNSSGNVGIGTSNPDQKLTVKGKIHSEEVIVDLNVAPDFVFEKYFTGQSFLDSDYEMLSLEEIEAFAKENHHLPDVPSAAEFQKNGLKVSEMTSILLQKIEELTLYTIEQEKRIKALESKIYSK